MSVHTKVVQLKNGEPATLFCIDNSVPEQVPEGIKDQLREIYNTTIEAGLTYPFNETLASSKELDEHWLAYSCAILVAGEHEKLEDSQEVLGTYCVKPNYAGRCSHVSNAGFLVNSKVRGQGIGKLLGQTYVQYAPTLGYTYSVFNLVFATNSASWKIWDSLGFTRIGVVPGAARLKGIDYDVDAYIYGKKLVE